MTEEEHVAEESLRLLSQIRGLLYLAGTNEEAAKRQFNALCQEHDRAELAAVVAAVTSEFEEAHGR